MDFSEKKNTIDIPSKKKNLVYLYNIIALCTIRSPRHVKTDH
jgi:hypothetical protein